MEYRRRAPHENAVLALTYEDQDGDWMMVGDVPWEYVSALLQYNDYNMI
jgi:auxin-responsive protein IAA